MAYNIIFDIDQTIVDSSSAEEYRNNGNWNAALHEIDTGNVLFYDEASKSWIGGNDE